MTSEHSGCRTILINSLELRLPARKLKKVYHTVSKWLDRKVAKRRELESLVGVLQHAAKIVRPGRHFADLGDVISQGQRSLC